jgi:hypothetical protein
MNLPTTWLEALEKKKQEAESNPTAFKFNDGGRASAGFKGTTGDCVVRAIAIATKQEYKLVYDELTERIKSFATSSRSRAAKSIKTHSPSKGVHREVYEKYLSELGWKFVPTMGIGTGCTLHIGDVVKKEGEILCSSNRIIARVSKHLVAIVEGVVEDTYDCTRGGNRCIYGYYTQLT